MRSINGYKNLSLLHESQHYAIYRAQREKDSKSVVLKLIRSDRPEASEIARLYNEFEISRSLSAPELLKSYALIDEGGYLALVLEDLQGVSLGAYLDQEPLRDREAFYRLAVPMVRALAAVHRASVIHKDIKPANFIINPETGQLKLGDFHIAVRLSHETQGLLPPDKLEGTLSYIAPEQSGRMNMRLDYRADLYALGITFYELLAGEPPFQADDPLELIHAHLTQPAPAVSDYASFVSPALSAVIQKLMSKNPSERYQSCAGLLADLRRCQRGELESDLDSFVLGQDDRPEYLVMAEKLYCRETELAQLLDAYQRICRGALEAVFLAGPAGIGKSKLIREVHKPMLEQRGYFLEGKFDQLQRSTPYSAIRQALKHLARQIQSEPPARFEQVQKQLSEDLGSDASLLLGIAPELSVVLAEAVDPAHTSNALAPNRDQVSQMNAVFIRLIGSLASAQHPLVLAIDDLQWMDSSSQQLIQALLCDYEGGHLLFIGSYRSDEVSADHPLRFTLDAVQEASVRSSVLSLRPLSVDGYERLLIDSLNLERDELKELAALLHRRTEGNPFFLKQLMQLCYDRGLLVFDDQQSRWAWDVAKIAQLGATDNVIDLMVSKIDALPEATRSLLSKAACIGNRFSLDLLALDERDATAVAKNLRSALQAELVLGIGDSKRRVELLARRHLQDLPLREVRLRFMHDRLQQAVYQLISDEQKERIHLDLARSLLKRRELEPESVSVYALADHYNDATGRIDDREQRLVIELNIEAASAAMQSIAYEQMHRYSKAALAMLASTRQDIEHALRFRASLLHARSEYLLSHFDEALALTQDLLDQAQSNAELIDAYQLLMQVHNNRREFQASTSAGLQALRLRGFRVSEQPTSFSLLARRISLWWKLKNYDLETLDQTLSPIDDPEFEELAGLLSQLIATSYWHDQVLSAYLSMLGLELTLKHGRCKATSYFPLYYAAYLLNYQDQIESSLAFYNLAKRLADAYEDKFGQVWIDGLGGVVLLPLRVHPRDCMRLFVRAAQLSYELGYVFGSMAMRGNFGFNECAQAKSLDKTLQGFEAAPGHYMTPLLPLFKNLETGQEDRQRLIQEIETELLPNENAYLRSQHQLFLCFLSYFAEDMELCVKHQWGWYPVQRLRRFEANTNQIKTLCGLAIAERLPQLRGVDWLRHRVRLVQITRFMAWLAKAAPDNFLHHSLFLKAAALNARGDLLEAIELLDQAIANARKGEFTLWVAVGNELACKFLHQAGKDQLAQGYMVDAHHYYRLYGMRQKAQLLKERYPSLERILERQEHTSTHLGTVTHTTGMDASSGLDVLAVLKANQAISEEIQVDKLLEQVLRIVAEAAGATRTVFIERQSSRDWVVVAAFSETFTRINCPVDEYQEVAQTAFHVAVRSKTFVTCADATQDLQFQQDPYVRSARPRSLLCLPIRHQDESIGLIYLENNQVPESFSQDRIALLNGLSAQIAISLVNARHLEETQRLYAATERFLPKAVLKLVGRDNVEEVKLGDSDQRVMSALFADIRSYTSITENMSPSEAFAFINRYLALVAPIIRKHHGFIDKYQGDAVMALFPRSADDAVRAGIDMLLALKLFNQQQKELGLQPIRVGHGVNTGLAQIGLIGEEARMEATVIADAVNLASRVEGLTKLYGVDFLISGNTLEALKVRKRFFFRLIDKVKVKGKRSTVTLYEVLVQDRQSAEQQLFAETYERGFAAYEAGDLTLALEHFEDCALSRPEDGPTQILLERCRSFLHEGLPANWDGSVSMRNK